MYEAESQAIRQADAFHKKIDEMFDDLWALVNERGISMEIRGLLGPEGNYWVERGNSEHRRLVIFRRDGKTRFVHFLIKVNDGSLRNKGSMFKAVCAKLGVDPVVPLIVCYGIFEPRDMTRFAPGDQAWIQRRWAFNTVLLDVPDDGSIIIGNLDSYSMDRCVPVESADGTNSQYCEKATVKIRHLMKIRDSRDIETLVNDLLSM